MFYDQYNVSITKQSELDKTMNSWLKMGLIILAGTLAGVMVKTIVAAHTAAVAPPASNSAPA